MKDWMYNEFNQVGTDYSKEHIVSEYDLEMGQFRDYDQEAHDFVAKLDVANPEDLTVIDIGCGTGAFAIHAAHYFKKMIAVDVSPEMLSIADSKAEAKGIRNVEFTNSGFLQFQPTGQVDVIHTKWVLHHLPDYWKQAALLNMNKMLKPGGVLYISDVIYKFNPDYETYLSNTIEDVAKKFSAEFVAETKIHIRDEYSTFDWVMQGFIERAGFDIQSSNTEDSLESEYFCRKVKSLGDESTY
jgi:ubiquinone/menaquinone biosynthesis C-methylase UbiE